MMKKTKHITMIILLLCAFNAKAQHNVIMEALEGCPGDDQYLVHAGQKAVKICGQIWMRHNLGANYNLDPDNMLQTTAWGLNGAYIQWGKRGPTTDWRTAGNNPGIGFAAAPTASDPNAASLPGWSTVEAADNSWNSGTEQNPVKTSADPCPAGYRIPTNSDWKYLRASTTAAITPGVWTLDTSGTRYSNALKLTSTEGNFVLTLPAAGFRRIDGGWNNALVYRGSDVAYWNSYGTGTGGLFMPVSQGRIFDGTGGGNFKTNGYPVRCIAE